MLELTAIQKIAVAALPLLLAITLHEVAHGWVAYRCGDYTAKMLGRLSINPFRHIDLFGTIILPIMLFYLSGFRFTFGYAKPVPVNWRNLKKPRIQMPLVALAGPFANLLMALCWAMLAKSVGTATEAEPTRLFLMLMAHSGIVINIVLMVLNLIPLPPLDGSRVMSALLPPRLSYYYDGLESYGFYILIMLMATGIFNSILTPPTAFTLDWIYRLFSL